MRKVALAVSNYEALTIASSEFALTQSWLALLDFFKLLAVTSRKKICIFSTKAAFEWKALHRTILFPSHNAPVWCLLAMF